MRHESFSLLRPASFRSPDALPLPSVPSDGRKVVARRALGIRRADDWLGGGLRSDGLHEFYAAEGGDLAGTLGLALLLGLMPGEGGKPRPLLWLRSGGGRMAPYGPGLVELGLDPAAVILLSLPDGRAVLRAALDGVRAGATGAVLIELSGRQPLLDLTTTRRLVLAAGETGTTVLLVRANAGPSPSAAHSRWRVASAPSLALEADAPGFPAFRVELLRHRGGREGLSMILEWNRDTASFREREEQGAVAAPLSGRASAVDAGAERPDPQSRAA